MVKLRTRVKTNSKITVDTKTNLVKCVTTADMQYTVYSPIIPFILSTNPDLCKRIERMFPGVNVLKGTFTVKSIAKCHPDDTFDKITGSRLAKDRAEIKVYHIANRIYDEICKVLELTYGKIVEYADNCLEVENNLFSRIENLK